MKTILLTLTATALTLITSSASQANPKSSSGPKGGSMHSNFKDYHLCHGTKFDHGYFYRGRNHEHWGETRFDRRFGCNVFLDRGLNAWFYWCERDICFYPVSYCPYRTYVCPPVVVEPVRSIIRPLVATPVPVPVIPPVNVRVTVDVNVQTATALPSR